MKRNAWFIIASVVVCAASYFVFSRIDRPTVDTGHAEAIKEINALRVEIVKLDSLRRVEQQRQIDSIMQQIKVTQLQAEKLNAINQKLRKQNEKLDRIYNSVHADIPEF